MGANMLAVVLKCGGEKRVSPDVHSWCLGRSQGSRRFLYERGFGPSTHKLDTGDVGVARVKVVLSHRQRGCGWVAFVVHSGGSLA